MSAKKIIEKPKKIENAENDGKKSQILFEENNFKENDEFEKEQKV
jgi:hypothetical protein